MKHISCQVSEIISKPSMMSRNMLLKSIEINKTSEILSFDTTWKTSDLKEKAVPTVMLVLEE